MPEIEFKNVLAMLGRDPFVNCDPTELSDEMVTEIAELLTDSSLMKRDPDNSGITIEEALTSLRDVSQMRRSILNGQDC